jgi:hypothetical protein
MVEKSGLKLLDSFIGDMRPTTRELRSHLHFCTILGVNSQQGETLLEKNRCPLNTCVLAGSRENSLLCNLAICNDAWASREKLAVPCDFLLALSLHSARFRSALLRRTLDRLVPLTGRDCHGRGGGAH